jgi:hypothetical protein
VDDKNEAEDAIIGKMPWIKRVKVMDAVEVRTFGRVAK